MKNHLACILGFNIVAGYTCYSLSPSSTRQEMIAEDSQEIEENINIKKIEPKYSAEMPSKPVATSFPELQSTEHPAPDFDKIAKQLSQYPSDPEATQNLAKMILQPEFITSPEATMAITFVDALLKNDDTPEALKEIAAIFLVNLGDDYKAAAILQAQMESLSGDGYQAMAKINCNQNKLEESIKLLESAKIIQEEELQRYDFANPENLAVIERNIEYKKQSVRHGRCNQI